jgi:SAM-dependent methyltransferase
MEITKKNISDFLESINYPQCKIKEYMIIIDNDLPYNNLESKEQIKTVFNIIKNINHLYARYASFNVESRLFDILTKRDPYYNFYLDIKNKIKMGYKDDNDIYNYVRNKRFDFKKYNKAKDNIPRDLCDARKLFSETLYYHFNNILPKNKKITTYLDVGAGDGAKTYYLSKLLKLEKDNVIGLDYIKFHSADYLKMRFKDVSFANMENVSDEYPFKNNQFDLTSSFMVLHHVKDLDFTFREINRVTKLNKYFILVDHNNFTSIDYMLTDIEHAMYEIVYKKGKPNYNFSKGDYMKYYSWVEWSILLERYGFKLITHGDITNSITSNINATLPFYGIYMKVENL